MQAHFIRRSLQTELKCRRLGPQQNRCVFTLQQLTIVTVACRTLHSIALHHITANGTSRITRVKRYWLTGLNVFFPETRSSNSEWSTA